MQDLTDTEREEFLKSIDTDRSQDEIFASIVRRLQESEGVSEEEAQKGAKNLIRFFQKLLDISIENERKENKKE